MSQGLQDDGDVVIDTGGIPISILKKLNAIYLALDEIEFLMSGKNTHQRYSYLKDVDLYPKIRLLLAKQCLALVPNIISCEYDEKNIVHIVADMGLYDVDTGEAFFVRWPMTGASGGGQKSAFSVQIALTQGMKSFLKMLLLVSSGEDGEDDKHSKPSTDELSHRDTREIDHSASKRGKSTQQPVEQKQAASPAQPATEAPAANRPFKYAQLKAVFDAVKDKQISAISPATLSKLTNALRFVFSDGSAIRLLTNGLFGVTSIRELNEGQALAYLRWLSVTQGDDGSMSVGKFVRDEGDAVIALAKKMEATRK